MPKINNNFNLYKDVFYPPEGYSTEYVELATYSLSPGFLCAIPAMIYAGNRGWGILESIRDIIKSPSFTDDKYYEKFHIFYDGSPKLLDDTSFYQGKLASLAINLLHNNCTPCIVKNALFHPKFILLQFKGKDGKELFYRLVILSRNLTWANYFEAGTILEGKPVDGENKPTNNVGSMMCKFLEKYDESCANCHARINLDSLAKTEFTIKDNSCELEALDLHFASIDEECFLNQIKEEATSYGEDASLQVISMNPSTELFKPIKTSYICNFQNMYKKSETSWINTKKDEDISFVKENINDKIKPISLHAKMYIAFNNKINSNYSVWMGSANCSENGLKRKNEEVLLHYKLTGDNSNSVRAAVNKYNSKFYTLLDKDLFYDSSDSFDEAAIDSIDTEEEFPSLNIKIDSVYLDSDNKKISVNITSFEEERLSVRFSNQSVIEEVYVDYLNSEKITSKYTAGNFSNILIINKAGRDFCYHLNIKDWPGENIEDIIKSIPLDIPDSVGKIIPPVAELTKPGDEAYERLIHHKIKDSDEDFKATVTQVRTKIASIESRRNYLAACLNTVKAIRTSAEVENEKENTISTEVENEFEMIRMEKASIDRIYEKLAYLRNLLDEFD